MRGRRTRGHAPKCESWSASADEASAAPAPAVDPAKALRRAMDAALNALAARPRATRELERLLQRKEVPPEFVAQIVERLTARGLLDDADFARGFARSRAVHRGQSRRRIEMELTKRGVARPVAAVAVREAFESEGIEEQGQVEAAARKKVRSLAKLEPAVRKRRLYAFLLRQGFASSVVSGVVRALCPASAPSYA